ncbi:hypothetical protein SSBR45G_11220 [Bradyrhizobium sp. SSBR45G]|nr:hypothetical protein SSBR45G_11220 [Bradyrhizobium sp. SSBR45G]GLH83302.1 hypothetical protein SSBR45R_07620 [Bradyrhizobium sp. SSBR45R]
MEDVGLARAIGASTLTGGRSEAGCASADDIEATAIRPATADTLVTKGPSPRPSVNFIAAPVRSERGALTCPIYLHAPQIFHSTSLTRIIRVATM